MVTAKEIYDYIDSFAPFETAMSFDNVGILIGDSDICADKALLALDITSEIINEAVEKGISLIVTHHPIIFSPLRAVSSDSLQYKLIRSGITVISAHTNLDSAKNGVMYKMAEKIGLADCEIINPRFAEDSGDGLIGNLPTPLAAEDFVRFLKRTFNVKALAHNAFGGTIRKVALCGGAGAFLIGDALRSGADAFVTGEIKYHDYFGYDDKMMLCALGHYESEQFTTEIFTSIIKEVDTNVPVFVTNVNTNPIIYL